MDFRERLKDLRKRKGLSQVALSERLGLSKSTIGAYETGDITPSLEALNTIADFFNVGLDYLLGEDDGSMYYLQPEVAELAKELHEREEMRLLFDTVKDVSKEDIETVIKMIKGLKNE